MSVIDIKNFGGEMPSASARALTNTSGVSLEVSIEVDLMLGR